MVGVRPPLNNTINAVQWNIADKEIPKFVLCCNSEAFGRYQRVLFECSFCIKETGTRRKLYNNFSFIIRE